MYYFIRSTVSILLLAYWCGEYGVLDMCVHRISEYWPGSLGEHEYQPIGVTSLLPHREVGYGDLDMRDSW